MATLLDVAIAALSGEDYNYPTPGALAIECEPRTVQTAVLDILDQALVDAADGKAPRLIFTMPPQEGKSQRCSRWFPLWLLKRNPDLRIAIASYADTLALRWGRQIRNDLRANPQLGLRVRADTAAAHEWQLEGHDGGVITVGIGSGITGRPVDVLIIDDPVKDQSEADSETYRQRNIDWWESAASARLAEDAIVILIMTRWHEDDLGGHLANTGTFRVINIPAECDVHPDPLGRELGEFMPSARGRTVSGWQARKHDAGSRAWNALYQGRPAPAEGGIFKREWWRTHHFPPMIDAYGRAYVPGIEEYQIHVDATFKDTSKSDFVCMQVWGRQGAKARLLDQVHGRMDYPTTRDALVALVAKWPAARARYIEDKANGPAIISELSKSLGGMIAVSPKDSKEARAHAVTPYIEAGDVELPDPSFAPWVNDFIEECSAFPNGAHDDQVDAMTQALDKILGSSRGLQGALEALHGLRRVA